MYSSHYNVLRSINSILRKNRRVLEELLGDETQRLNREKLLQHGFHFGYHTHVREANDGRTEYYCYDYGYRPISADSFQLVRTAEN